MYSCAGNPPGASIQNNTYNNIINMYSGEYFIGVGTGKGSTKEMAIKIAKARALGELADNVKVTIMSKLEVISTEITVGNQTQVSESVKEKIISLGNATVRSPEYEILNISRRDAEFHFIFENDNQLTGTIPREIGMLTALRWLRLVSFSV